MYSDKLDYQPNSPGDLKNPNSPGDIKNPNSPGEAKKKKGLTPLQQLHKLVSSAAKFDQEMDAKLLEKAKPFRRSRITVDKTLLKNHLRHTHTHNRLKEENEMWDMHKNMEKQKKVYKKVELKSRDRSSGSFGSMYSDREPGRTDTKKIRSGNMANERTDTKKIRSGNMANERTDTQKIRSGNMFNEIRTQRTDFGKFTKKLLEMKEKDDSKWGHGGFKEMYADKLAKSNKKVKKSERDELTKSNKNLRKSEKSRSRNIISDSSSDGEDDVKVISESRENGSVNLLIKMKSKRKEIE